MNKKRNTRRTAAHFEIEFFEKLLKDDPVYVDALLPLAEAYTKVGQYGKGLEIDKRLAVLLPEDPTVFYNLACSHSLTGEIDDAFAALEKAIKLGYRDFYHLDNDPDLFSLRDDGRYKQMISDIIKQKGVTDGMGKTA